MSTKRKSASSQNQRATKRKRKTATENNNDPDSDIPDESIAGPSQSLSNRTPIIRSGKILSIGLTNFMCHERLKVDFNSRANLLIGQNGSGKSAILTALIVGLGCRATATNRSKSIKQFIRYGEQSATVEIHLSNDGADSFERSIYGNRIIVVRKMTASGSSTYQLKNSSGNVISTARTELAKMIMYMNVQVDNPVCVLTQDASRSFLRDSNPKARYEFFMKATQLDVVIGILDSCAQQVNSTRSKISSQEVIRDKLKENETKVNTKLQQLQSMEPLKVEIRNYKIEQNWVQVIRQEEFMQEVNIVLKGSQDQRTKFERKLSEISDNGDQNNQKIVELTTEIDSLTQSLNGKQQEMDADKAVYRRRNEELLEVKRIVKTFEGKQKNIQETIRKLEENIQDELQSNRSQVQELRDANEKKLNELRAEELNLEATIKTHKRDLDVFNGAKAKYKTQYGKMEERKQELEKEQRSIQMQLKSIHAAPKEVLSQIADYMPNLVDTIEKYYKNGKFHKMPIGPIASHVEIINPKYRQYVEDVLQSLLLAFCVDNPDDNRTLRTLLKTNFPNFTGPIVTFRFQAHQYNVSNNCVNADGKCVRLFDLIEVNEPNVMNCLIDQLGIETILFTEDFEYAAQITSKRENVPPNLSRIIVLKPYSEYYPAPSYRSYSKKSKNTRFLRVNQANRERTLQQDLANIQDRLDALGDEFKEVRPKIVENNRRIEERMKSIKEGEGKFRLLSLEINELESFEYPQEVEISVMKNEVEEQMKSLEAVKAKYAERKAKLDEITGDVKTIETKIQQNKTFVQTTMQQIHDKQQTKDKIEEQLGKRVSMTSHYQGKIHALNQAIDKLNRELSAAKEKLDRLEIAARKSGPRIESKRTYEDLVSLIKKNEQKINTVTNSKESVETVAAELATIREELEKTEELIVTLNNTVVMMRNAVRQRFSNLKSLKNYMVTRMSHIFTDIMKLRGCHGQLKFSDKERKLELSVVPRDKECDTAVSKVTNLSGGERSYVTVAFLISLWSCVDHPFFFLDEYDVFTDQVNRTYMTRLLLNEANKKKQYQYAFLTPQDVSEITATEHLKIQRLDNPR